MIRPATNDDSAALIALIDSVYREYGDRIFLEGADADLLDIDASYRSRGGEFVVLELDGRVVGCHATLPVDLATGAWTLRRLYLEKSLRGGRHGKSLMDWALDWCRDRGVREIVFWSDTRFTRAHRFFGRYGFAKGGTRDMDDGHMPYSEYRFNMLLDHRD